jgi:hypothetical protein
VATDVIMVMAEDVTEAVQQRTQTGTLGYGVMTVIVVGIHGLGRVGSPTNVSDPLQTGTSEMSGVDAGEAPRVRK